MHSLRAVRPVILMLGASLLFSGCAMQTPLPVVVRNAQHTADTAQQNAAAAMSAAQKAQNTADAAAQAAQQAQATALAVQAKLDAMTAAHQQLQQPQHRHHRHHKPKPIAH